MKLTQKNIQSLSLPIGVNDKIFFDADLPGFGLRIRAGGKRVWIAQYRIGTTQRRMTLPTAKANADEARKWAKSVLAKAQLGQDAQTEKATVKADSAVTLDAVADRYLERAETTLKPRSYVEVERYLRKNWSALSKWPIAKIEREQIAAQLTKIGKENGPYAANRARAALSAMFGWAIGEGIAHANPVIGTNKALDKEAKRKRVLTTQELSLLWLEVGEGDYADIVRLLFLTGQRREEVAGMLWSELDIEKHMWSLPSDRTKNKLPHDVPLSDASLAILQNRTKKENRDLVFGAGEGPFQGWSNAKTKLDERLLERLQEIDKKAQLEPWRVHDIRRTVATRLGDLGVLPHVVEAILNHVSGHKAGVAGIYNKSTYAPEKRKALDLWAKYVESRLNAVNSR